MANIKVETKNKVDIDRKPRVYFTCHPGDFDKYFKRVCDDIFLTHDCAIYYTEDMTEAIAEEDKEIELGRNNLFVIPVTLKLLTTPNRAMVSDFVYAKEHHIPVLPLMMEQGIDIIYSRPDKFGELQYIDPNNTDLTAISYGDKLKKYLESVLVSSETAERVRAAFDAYIFLSYRKKDRRYANQLMRLIHANPEYRDIAIWYDEFLTPGESFKTSIDKILSDSKLFTLLVTPNLLEDGNFVMREEYPAAHNSGIEILPAEMEETDKDTLKAKYEGIPECVDPNAAEFRERLLETLTRLATKSNDTPEHNFLIGLAYLDGIDVEVDRERGVELITSAAEAGLPEAMEKLYKMYDEGIGVQLDYRKAVIWAENLADYMVSEYGEEHPDALAALNNLALTYGKIGDHRKALELNEKVYTLRCQILGKEHPDTLTSLNNLAVSYSKLGDHTKTLELQEKLYAMRCRILGEEHPDTLASLNNLAYTYGKLGDHKKQLELNEKVYTLLCRILGEEHPDTLTSLNNLAYTYGELGEHKKEAELEEKLYAIRCRILGKEHPDTLNSLNNLAYTYGELGEYKKELELTEKLYVLRCKVLGEGHPDTLESLNDLAYIYSYLGNRVKELELTEKLYVLRCKVLGEEHPDMLTSLNNLAVTYYKLGDHTKALELLEKVYTLCYRILGEEHPDTLTSLSSLAYTYGKLGDYEKQLELTQKLYALRCRIFGEENPDTLASLNSLALVYSDLGDHTKAIELVEKAYTLRSKVLGAEHPDTLASFGNLAYCYKTCGDYTKAIEIYEALYPLRVKVLGEDHPSTLKVLEQMKNIRSRLQNDDTE